MPLIAYQYKFSEEVGSSAIPSIPSGVIQTLTRQLRSREWLCLRFYEGCIVFLMNENRFQPGEIWEALRTSGLVPSMAPEESTTLGGSRAVHRFFEITTGILSPFRGKNLMEVLREAYSQALELGCVGPIFHRLFNRGIWLHEKVRLETQFFRFAVREETMLRELAEKILGRLESTAIYVNGYGDVLCLILMELERAGCRKLYIAGEEKDVMMKLREWLSEHRMRFYPGTPPLPPEVDVLLNFPGTQSVPLTIQMIKQRMARRSNAPLVIFDWNEHSAFQADVDKIYNVFYYNQMDIEHVIAHNRQERHQELHTIQRWISNEVDEFYDWLQSEERFQFSGMIGTTPQMQRIFEMISRIAQTNITVLIDGESGTGKELVARAIHQLSGRAQKPFVVVNCGAIPENLLESELFGHVRGAFTGAVTAKAGLFEIAHQGTIFLDEIAELPPHLQVKLLRFLQDGEIKRVGSNETIQLDVRVLAATNKDLAQMVREGKFRSDLFYRLNVIQLTLPPLRERREDIPLLVKHFLKKFADKLRKEVNEISPQAMEVLINYHWPGNIRELENAIERAVALAVDSTLSVYDLPSGLQQRLALEKEEKSAGHLTLKELEKKHILDTLDSCGWNYELTCRRLGIGRTTLWRKLREYKVYKKKSAPGGD